MADEQPQVKLYWLNQSRAQNIVWLLEELGVKYDVEVFHRNKQTMLAPKELQAVHPLGKSPVVEVTPPGGGAPVRLAESGFIVQYLTDHFPEGARLVPPRWKPGRENTVGGETDAWMRYAYLLHYVEGSFFPVLTMSLVISVLKSTRIPFFIRPITSMVADQIIAAVIAPNAKRNLGMLETFLETVPGGGSYICGDSLTAVDILLSFALIAAEDRFDNMGKFDKGSAKETYPRVFEYIARLKQEPGYKRSTDKIREIDGDFQATLSSK